MHNILMYMCVWVYVETQFYVCVHISFVPYMFT